MKYNKLSSKEWELISSYLDNELNAQEKARLEERFKTHSEYQEALDGLRRTKAILQKAPVRKVPRNFTLTQADVQPVRRYRWAPLMQLSSAAVALVAAFLFAWQLAPGFIVLRQQPSNELTSAEPTEGVMEFAAPEATGKAAAMETPEIIYWGGAPLPSGGFGMGGGGNGCGGAGAMCGGGAADGIGGGGAGAPATQMLFPQPPIPNPLPDLQATSTTRTTEAPAEPVTGTGPVLGVRPMEAQGEVLPETRLNIPVVSDTAREAEPEQASPWLLPTAGGLLVLAVGLFIAGAIARRKSTR